MSLGQRRGPVRFTRGRRSALPERIEEIPAWYAEEYQKAIQDPMQAFAFDKRLDVARAYRVGQLKAGLLEARQTNSQLMTQLEQHEGME